jgi:hypothetical protein
MCKWGDTVPVALWIDDSLSYTGRGRWKVVQIDRCIAPVVKLLQANKINTLASCCGHGKEPGTITLAPTGEEQNVD